MNAVLSVHLSSHIDLIAIRSSGRLDETQNTSGSLSNRRPRRKTHTTNRPIRSVRDSNSLAIRVVRRLNRSRSKERERTCRRHVFQEVRGSARSQGRVYSCHETCRRGNRCLGSFQVLVSTCVAEKVEQAVLTVFYVVLKENVPSGLGAPVHLLFPYNITCVVHNKDQ